MPTITYTATAPAGRTATKTGVPVINLTEGAANYGLHVIEVPGGGIWFHTFEGGVSGDVPFDLVIKEADYAAGMAVYREWKELVATTGTLAYTAYGASEFTFDGALMALKSVSPPTLNHQGRMIVPVLFVRGGA